MEVYQDLVDARRVEGVEPDIEHWPVIDDQHALWGGVGDRPQPSAETGREEEGLHASILRTTPSARILALASASTPSRPSSFSSHAAYSATDSAGVRRGSHPSARRALMSERMWRVSPERYSPVTTPGKPDPYWRMT